MATPQQKVIPTVEWSGGSGSKYKYWVHPLPFSCDPDQLGNYIFSKIVDNVWVPIYIGEGDLNVRCNDREHYPCARLKGATYLHCHTQPVETARLAEERDLLAGHPSAYAPKGCNQRLGG